MTYGLRIARELQALLPVFDADQFAADLDNPEVLESFRPDIKDRYLEISRFPTLVLHAYGDRKAILVGYRPYGALQEALAALAPTLHFTPAQGGAATPAHLGQRDRPRSRRDVWA